jgi:hypothetical protein
VGPFYGECYESNIIDFARSLFFPNINESEKRFIRLTPEESRVKGWQSWFFK